LQCSLFVSSAGRLTAAGDIDPKLSWLALRDHAAGQHDNGGHASLSATQREAENGP
jgi:hypothetical protein